MAGSGFPESGRGQRKLQVGKVTGGRAVNDLLRFSSLMLSCCNLFGSEQVQALKGVLFDWSHFMELDPQTEEPEALGTSAEFSDAPGAAIRQQPAGSPHCLSFGH